LQRDTRRHVTCDALTATVRLRLPSLSVFVITSAMFVLAVRSAAAQTPARVRVVGEPAPIVEWFPYVKREVLMTVQPGTTLEVLGKEGGMYWIVTNPDAYRTRRAGWISMRNVEIVAETARLKPAPVPAVEAARPLSDLPTQASNAPAVATGANTEPTRVQISSNKEYTFEDIQFARNRFHIAPDESRKLDEAANVLKGDSLLRLSIEGYTCSLGTAQYNLALGNRRANAVKEYLVGQGVPADRLQTISFGEERAKYDNSREETRKLNRRVALVPNAGP
jgi:outer membrane protein OmpA-like peptidoglycan-associated protein